MQYSQDFTASSGSGGWAKYTTTITANSVTAPDGTTTASTATSSGTSAPRVAQTKTSAGTYIFSIYLKQGTDRYIQLIDTFSGTDYANFDLQTGVVTVTGAGVTSSITSVGSGWYRCTISRAMTGTYDFAFGFTDNNSTAGYAPTLTNTGLTTYAWGAQLEQRSSVTAYTATTTAAITNYIPALQTAASGVARFDHNPTTGESLGLLIEEQRTNLVQYSEQVDNAYWSKIAVSVTANAVVSPDGTLTADKLTPSATNDQHVAYKQSLISSGSVTMSVYAKAGEYTWLFLSDTLGANNGAYFNLATGALGTVGSNATATITPVGNNWYRCTVTTTATSTSGIGLYVASANNTVVFTGNGFSGIYIWGAQLEAGAYATSYIPTVASQVTRSADSASMTGTNFSSWFRTDEGTVYAEATTYSTPSYVAISSINDSALPAANRFAHGINSSVTNLYVVTNSSTAVNAITSGGTIMTNKVFGKSAYCYKANDFAISGNGATVQTDTSGAIPIVNQLFIGNDEESRRLNGSIKKLAYYPKRLTNAELQGLTTV